MRCLSFPYNVPKIIYFYTFLLRLDALPDVILHSNRNHYKMETLQKILLERTTVNHFTPIVDGCFERCFDCATDLLFSSSRYVKLSVLQPASKGFSFCYLVLGVYYSSGKNDLRTGN